VHRGDARPALRALGGDVLQRWGNAPPFDPYLGYREIAGIVKHNLGYSMSHSTVKGIIDGNPNRIQYELPLSYKDYDDPLTARVEVVKLYYQGWSPKSISGYLKISRRYIHKIMETFAQEHFAGLRSKSKSPKRHYRKVYLPLMRRVYLLQKEYPRAGRFRIWGFLKDKLDVNERTIGRIMETHRKLYPELIPQKEVKDEKEKRTMPYRARRWHQFWFIDIRYLDKKVDGKKVYSICLLEGYSRAILAGTVSFKQDLWAILKVFYSACLNRGLPKAIVSRHYPK
jgi:hypothetical protein